jgi:hypothetical protein
VSRKVSVWQPRKFSKFFHSPTDTQMNCLKNNFKIYIKINIKTAPTCCGIVTPSSVSALFVLAKAIKTFDNIKMHGMYVKNRKFCSV